MFSPGPTPQPSLSHFFHHSIRTPYNYYSENRHGLFDCVQAIEAAEPLADVRAHEYTHAASEQDFRGMPLMQREENPLYVLDIISPHSYQPQSIGDGQEPCGSCQVRFLHGFA